MTNDKLQADMNETASVPGIPIVWTQPIRNRLDMLVTGVKTPVGVKISDPTSNGIQRAWRRIENARCRPCPDPRRLRRTRTPGGPITRYHPTGCHRARRDDDPDVPTRSSKPPRRRNITRTIEGRDGIPGTSGIKRVPTTHFPKPCSASPRHVTVRCPVPDRQLAAITLAPWPSHDSDENGRLAGYVYVETTTSDIGGYRRTPSEADDLPGSVTLPPRRHADWTGQFEFQVHARKTLQVVLPIVLAVIFVLLTMTFRSSSEATIVMLSVLYAMTGGVILQWALGYNFSVAVWIGYIALYGVAVETGVVMVIYLHEALDRKIGKGELTAPRMFWKRRGRGRSSASDPS